MNVLVIEDSPEIVESVTLCFQMRWPDAVISSAPDGGRGLAAARNKEFDMIILDINLPDMDGFRVLKELRTFSTVPIVILSVRGREEDRVRGFENGADDYVVKPFSPRDLMARVNAVMRRATPLKIAGEQPLVVRGEMTLDLVAAQVKLGKNMFKLTQTEARLLYALMKNTGRTVDDDRLFREVWGREPTDRELLRSYIRRLRERLGDNPPQIIVTERGQGYRFISP